MTLRKLLLYLVLMSLAGASFSQYRDYVRAQRSLQQLIAGLRPAALTRYERFWPYLHGETRVWNLALEPAGEMKQVLGTPFGYRLRIDEMRLQRLELDEQGRVQTLSCRLHGVHVPILEAHSAEPGEGDPLDNAPPTLSDLGYQELALDAELYLRYQPEDHRVRVRFNALSPDTARVYLELELQTDGDTLLRADLLNSGFTALKLEYTDQGLIRRYQEAMAQRGKLSVEGFQQALVARLDALAKKQKWKWNARAAGAFKSFLRDPSYGSLELLPLNTVDMKNISLYARGDWFALFGFNFSNSGSFSVPPPKMDAR